MYQTFLNLKELVATDKMWAEQDKVHQDSIQQTQCQFKIGLATCMSKNAKHLKPGQKSVIMDWLKDQVELYGGDETAF